MPPLGLSLEPTRATPFLGTAMWRPEVLEFLTIRRHHGDARVSQGICTCRMLSCLIQGVSGRQTNASCRKGLAYC